MPNLELVQIDDVCYIHYSDATLPAACPRPDIEKTSKVSLRSPLEVAKHTAGIADILDAPVCWTTCDIQCEAKNKAIKAIEELEEPELTT
ncbi:hypothetical protein ACFLZH_01280 [Patescibacteria group bacterium]